MQTPSPTVPEDILGTVLRLLAYMGTVAVLVIATVSVFHLPMVAAAHAPSPRPPWTEIERPYRAFDLRLPGTDRAARYAVLRHDADDGRKDILTWGEAGAGGAPYAELEIFRPGRAGERFIDAPSEVAARIIALPVTDDVKSAGTTQSKFGPVPLVAFAFGAAGSARRCLGFARAFVDPTLQIAGWYCGTAARPVRADTVACTLDRLTIASAGGDERLAQLFARAEVKRTFCGQLNPILAATPEGRARVAAPRPRGRRFHHRSR